MTATRWLVLAVPTVLFVLSLSDCDVYPTSRYPDARRLDRSGGPSPELKNRPHCGRFDGAREGGAPSE
jgi:hypothetical protein